MHTLGNLCGGVLQLYVDSILSYLSYDLKLFNYDLECWKYTDTETETHIFLIFLTIGKTVFLTYLSKKKCSLN